MRLIFILVLFVLSSVTVLSQDIDSIPNPELIYAQNQFNDFKEKAFAYRDLLTTIDSIYQHVIECVLSMFGSSGAARSAPGWPMSQIELQH